MASIISLLMIGISLSMDAFSLALVYGLSIIEKRDKLILSFIVAIYHFIMPLIGNIFGNIIYKINIIDMSLISSFIIIYVGIEVILSKNEEFNNNLVGYIIFGLSVSIDSLTIGIGLKAITNNYLLASFIFSISSFLFTVVGLNIGSFIGKHISKYSRLLGGIILIIIGFSMLFNVT